MEKYKELYTYSKEAFEREYDRFKSIDKKATQYLSVLTLLIGIAGFFGNWVVENFVPPMNIWEFILLALTVLILATLTAGWFQTFYVIRMQDLETYPLNSEVIDFFNSENEPYIYYELSRKTHESLMKNMVVGNRKSKTLISAYKYICVSVILLIVFSISFGAYKWNSNSMRSTSMPEDSDQKKSDPQPKETPREPVSKIPTPSSDKKFPNFEKVDLGEKPIAIRDPDVFIITTNDS